MSPDPCRPAAAAAEPRQSDPLSSCSPSLQQKRGSMVAGSLTGKLPSLPAYEPVTEIDERDKQSADDWVPRHKGLIRLTGKHPFNCEPAPNTLVDQGFITPVPLHYVRNHGAVPRLTWEGHHVRVLGQGLAKEHSFSMDQLAAMELRSFPVTLVCAGNRRKEVNMTKQSKGFNWGPAAVSTSVWTGVPLHALLKACGVTLEGSGVFSHVCFDGPDLELHHGTYGTSIPLRKALDPAQDVLVAFEQNGERLHPDHGFPVRIIIPGYIGGRMVKWLTRITITAEESQSYYHYYDNRVLPPMVDNDRADKEDWWHKPDYIINDLNINSAITHPAHNEEVVVSPYGSSTYRVRGYAYAGAGRRITRVELSFDEGQTWEVTGLSAEEYPTEHGRFWCWRHWELEVDVLRFVGGSGTIHLRAWDDCQNTQPRDLTWNVMGMMNNCWYKVLTAVGRTPQGQLRVKMTHPVVAGAAPGGWMVRAAAPAAADESKGAVVATAKAGETAQVAVPSSQPLLPRISPVELARHNTREDCWIGVKGHVYDVTPYLAEHPGGLASLVGGAGKDVTEDFEGIHSPKAWTLLKKFLIGILDPAAPVPPLPGTTASPGVASHEEKVQPVPHPTRMTVRLINKTTISRDVVLLKFALGSPDVTLGLRTGDHVQVRARIDGKLVLRSYTPVSLPDQKGSFDLLIRVYRANEHPKFPQGGLMSQHLDSLPVGLGSIDIDPPHGFLLYEQPGVLSHLGTKMAVKQLACVAGGTGITPIWQVLRAVLDNKDDPTTIHLVYAARSPSDLLLRPEMDALAEKHADRFKVWYCVDVLDGFEGTWAYSIGHVTDAILGEHWPKPAPDVPVLFCGPPPMLKFAVKPSADKLGFNPDLLLSF